MLGAIIGDIVGSRFEFVDFKSKDFDLFHPACNYTDDSICTIATAAWLMEGGDFLPERYSRILQKICREYPHPMGGYGGSFAKWVKSEEPTPYGSYGNGSAMRVSPVGWVFDNFEETMEMAKRCASVTHNHREGVKGAQATAAAIYWARTGHSKTEIRSKLEELTGYDLNKSCDDIRPHYHFNETCQGTVPEAIIAFLDSTSFEDAIRLAISLGGDSDTLTCITGSIAEAFYGIPKEIADRALGYLPNPFRQLYLDFAERYIPTESRQAVVESVDLTPEYKEKSTQLTTVKELYLILLLEYNDLLKVVKPNLTSLYLLKIGHRQLHLMECRAVVAALKYKMELLQAALNRNERANMEAIEQDIAAKMAAYIQQIKEQAAKIEEAQQHISGLMTPEESTELKKMYYALAKKLHPDVNPQQTEEEELLWLIVSNSYSSGDLETMRGIYLGEKDHKTKDAVYSGIEAMQKQIAQFDEHISALNKKTKELKNNFPFNYEELLMDDARVAGEIARIDSEIAIEKETETKLQQYISLIIESLP